MKKLKQFLRIFNLTVSEIYEINNNKVRGLGILQD